MRPLSSITLRRTWAHKFVCVVLFFYRQRFEENAINGRELACSREAFAINLVSITRVEACFLSMPFRYFGTLLSFLFSTTAVLFGTQFEKKNVQVRRTSLGCSSLLVNVYLPDLSFHMLYNGYVETLTAYSMNRLMPRKWSVLFRD